MKVSNIQNFINWVYRHPKGRLQHISRFGGFFKYRQMLRENKRMRSAALALPPVQSYEDGLPVYFLTGNNFLYQTLFCIRSLVMSTDKKFKFHIIDDGSLDIAFTRKKLPGALITGHDEINARVNKLLPLENFPVLHRKRAEYAHIKKLTDIHSSPDSGYKLVLDSDMLFWKEPVAMINWLKKPTGNLFMQDCLESYGYTPGLMKSLCNAEIPSLLNVGVAGIASDQIIWEEVETWIKALEEKEGGSYYLEQALTAMLTAGRRYTILPASDYVVYPSDRQIQDRDGTLHHFVDLSKKAYFTKAWKQFI